MTLVKAIQEDLTTLKTLKAAIFAETLVAT